MTTTSPTDVNYGNAVAAERDAIADHRQDRDDNRLAIARRQAVGAVR